MKQNTTFIPLSYSIAATVRVTGVKRSKLYMEIAAGHLKSIKIGDRRLILHEDLVEYLRSRRQA